ncbi:MAG: protein kinase [Blastopirellula sp.]|nr:MAG: protein kinase [Blastopirellula sp.]
MNILDKFKSLFKSKHLDIASRFTIEREAVSGTMSEFFVVREHSTGKMLGLKILDLEKQDFFESRFEGRTRPKEGEISCQMHHPNVVETFEHGYLATGQQYIVMEYIDGLGLAAMILDNDPKLVGNQVDLINQMADALEYVHKQEFIHRDICPRNFIVSKDGKMLKLIDFGLTLPATPEFMVPGNRTGTPNYMAPEIVRRRATDQRTDLFSFGVTAFRLCAYELPWPVGEGTGLAALNHDSMPPKDIFELCPGINETLGKAIMSCIEQDPNNRPDSVTAFKNLIRDVKSIDQA